MVLPSSPPLVYERVHHSRLRYLLRPHYQTTILPQKDHPRQIQIGALRVVLVMVYSLQLSR